MAIRVKSKEIGDWPARFWDNRNVLHTFLMTCLFVSQFIFQIFWYLEGNVLFNDALNTFYLRLYGVRHMVKDHSDSERGNQLPSHGLLFTISIKGSFICINTYHGFCYTSRGALAGTRNSSMGPPWANALTTELHLAPILVSGAQTLSQIKLHEYIGQIKHNFVTTSPFVYVTNGNQEILQQRLGEPRHLVRQRARSGT